MAEHLNEIEARVLGSLVEKQLTTPEYYPLTLNALTAACNQKSNRDPVVAYPDEDVTMAVDSLRDKNLVYLFYGSSSRVVKYKHMLPNVYDLAPPEVAVICVMLLRGAQTVGELRERTGRLFEFSNVAEVNETLDALMRRDEPLVVKLERQAGQKEARYAHLLSGEVVQQPASAAATLNVPRGDRIGELEGKVEAMQSEIAALRAMFDEFKKQFE